MVASVVAAVAAGCGGREGWHSVRRRSTSFAVRLGHCGDRPRLERPHVAAGPPAARHRPGQTGRSWHALRADSGAGTPTPLCAPVAMADAAATLAVAAAAVFEGVVAAASRDPTLQGSSPRRNSGGGRGAASDAGGDVAAPKVTLGPSRRRGRGCGHRRKRGRGQSGNHRRRPCS